MDFRNLILAALFLGYNVLNAASNNIFVAYGESSQIFIRNVATGVLQKTIKIREYDDIYVTLHYKEDLIFYAKGKKLYRIYLLDENGNRKISGKGALFTDPKADHVEEFLGEFKYSINGLAVDQGRKKLIIAEYDTIFERELDGSNSVEFLKAKVRSTVVHRGYLYFSMEKTWKTSGVYRVKLGNSQKPDAVEELVPQKNEDIFTLDVCPYSNKLFFRRGSSIKVLDTNLTASSYPISNPRVVLSNSEYTGGSGLLPIAIRGRYLVFLNKPSSDGQLYLGILNPALNFIPSKSIYVYGKPSYDFRPYQLTIFEHPFPTPGTKPITTPKICPCSGS